MKVTGTVEAISTKYDKFSIMVNDIWYGTKQEYADNFKALPNRGDSVEFDNGGKKFLSKLVIVGASASSGSPSSPAAKAPYSNLGMTLGHASNIGIKIALAGDTVVGSTEFYSSFINSTETVHKIMTNLNLKHAAIAQAGASGKLTETPVTESVVKAPEAKSESSDTTEISVDELF